MDVKKLKNNLESIVQKYEKNKETISEIENNKDFDIC